MEQAERVIVVEMGWTPATRGGEPSLSIDPRGCFGVVAIALNTQLMLLKLPYRCENLHSSSPDDLILLEGIRKEWEALKHVINVLGQAMRVALKPSSRVIAFAHTSDEAL